MPAGSWSRLDSMAVRGAACHVLPRGDRQLAHSAAQRRLLVYICPRSPRPLPVTSWGRWRHRQHRSGARRHDPAPLGSLRSRRQGALTTGSIRKPSRCSELSRVLGRRSRPHQVERPRSTLYGAGSHAGGDSSDDAATWTSPLATRAPSESLVIRKSQICRPSRSSTSRPMIVNGPCGC